MGRLSDRAVIVTGAAQGIGAAYAKALAAEGANVALCDVIPCDTVVDIIRQAGGEAFGSLTDVTDAESVAALVKETEARYGGVQGLVNNAAIFKGLGQQPFHTITSEDFDRVMTVNVRGSFECIKAVLPVMQRQGYGKIVNVASGTVFKGVPMMASYVTSKGAVIAMTRCLSRELGPQGIRINCIAPGLTMSEAVRDAADWTDNLVSANLHSRALKREEQPEDLTGTMAFLLSADSDFMTGQTIVVDGGSAMH
jgi:NAD(P)-dependent dehydrogenase (short-subunit alcohol dehydrogenase family)